MPFLVGGHLSVVQDADHFFGLRCGHSSDEIRGYRSFPLELIPPFDEIPEPPSH